MRTGWRSGRINGDLTNLFPTPALSGSGTAGSQWRSQLSPNEQGSNEQGTPTRWRAVYGLIRYLAMRVLAQHLQQREHHQPGDGAAREQCIELAQLENGALRKMTAIAFGIGDQARQRTLGIRDEQLRNRREAGQTLAPDTEARARNYR